MTEQQKNKRTRRRFLADMLFLGGGVTAAALLAKSQLAQPVEPQIAGAMEVPIEAKATPCPAPAQTPDGSPPMPGDPVVAPPPVENEPDIAGEVMMPPPGQPPMVKGDYAPPPPKTGGKPIAPQPNRDQR